MKLKLITCIAILAVVASCKKKTDDPVVEQLVPGPDQIVFAINANNDLIRFNARTPGTNLNKIAIGGIVAGERLLSIDFRPATGELYALSSASKLYIINQNDGSSRAVSTTAFTPAITGTGASIDFNPTVDRLRLVTNANQNLRLNPETGAVVATDMPVNGTPTPIITGVAYTNSKAGATTTIMYDIDQATSKLYRQDPPNNGTLAEVGSLGVTVNGPAAFDISSTNVALVGLAGSLYTLDLTTGKAGKIGATSETLVDIAIPTEQVAYAVDASNNLLIFNPAAPSAGVISRTAAGLQAGETVHGIDFRPANGQLYALGSSNRLYTVNLASGAYTQVGTGTFSTSLLGTDFGIDFNPTVDRIRVISNTGQNLRLNPIDGTIAAADANLNPGLPMPSATAYTNNFAGATSTVMFVVDASTDMLMIQNPPNAGTLTMVGPLGVNIDNNNGFDIGSRTGTAYLVAGVGSNTNIYTLNTATGAVGAAVTFPMSIKGFSIGTGF